MIEKHYVNRSGWLRAAVLGANDGILSTTNLAIGVAAASDTRNPIVLAALAGLVAGAMSMAAGEYVSVSSQSDIENADLKREGDELKLMPETDQTLSLEPKPVSIQEMNEKISRLRLESYTTSLDETKTERALKNMNQLLQTMKPKNCNCDGDIKQPPVLVESDSTVINK